MIAIQTELALHRERKITTTARTLDGYNGNYLITPEGCVFSRKSKRFLKPGRNSTGYLRVTLCVLGKKIRRFLHHLVLENFGGPKPEGMEARHINGNRQDNRAMNLVWATHVENMKDLLKHGTLRCGERHHCASKISDRQVIEIRKMYSPRHPRFGATPLAARFGVCLSTIERIGKGRSRNITTPFLNHK